VLTDARVAVSLLTVLPVGAPATARPGRAAAYYPLVGLVVGGLAGLVAVAAGPLGPDLTAWLVLLVWIGLTGGLHLDGFADSCDGLLATTSPERRLEIMRDPRAGAWAIVGLVLLLLGKWLALRGLAPALLLLPPLVARWAVVLAMVAFPAARPGGLGATMRAGVGRRDVAVASLTVLVVVGAMGLALTPLVGLTPIAGGLAVLGLGRWAAGRLNGGLTGDVYGALIEVVELLCLLALHEVSRG
jgi:adenosylcobinamide-GDP ribazoletransferase